MLTAVVGFGSEPRMLTKEPTDRIEVIEAAVKAIKDDESGQENVFQAVGMVAEKFRPYRSAKNGKRHVMIVVFTDEAGDDTVHGTSIMSLLTLGAAPGSTILVEADGADAREALEAINAMICAKFDEE